MVIILTHFQYKFAICNLYALNLVKEARIMVFNTTFNNISVISWRSVLLVKEPEYPEKTTDLPQVTDKLYYIHFVILYSHTRVNLTSRGLYHLFGLEMYSVLTGLSENVKLKIFLQQYCIYCRKINKYGKCYVYNYIFVFIRKSSIVD